MNRAGAAAPPPRTTKPRPPLKTTPVGPPGTATLSACFRPSAVYTVLELRASFATHHAPPALAANPQAFTSCGSTRSETICLNTNRSGRARPQRRLDVRLEVRRPLRVVHASVVGAHISEGGAVLGDVDHRRRVLLGDAHQQAVEAVRVDLPAHVGVLRLRVAHHLRPVRTRADDEAEVVVDAEEVDRRRDRREVAVLHEPRDELVALEQVGGIGTPGEPVE